MFLIALVASLALVRPFEAGPVSYDVGSSVIHFQRLAAGRHLEAFISTTPKPLITLIDGGLFAAFGDWRAISWATLLAAAGAVVIATWLATRLAGLPAGAFVAVALIASRSLAGEAIIASAIPWAMLGWAVAGLAVTARRPRYRLAGLALFLASLARLETLVVVAVAGAVLVGAWLGGRRQGRARVPRDAWWLLLGFLALPVMLLHDWLLTGDPFFWVSVSARYSEAAGEAVLTPLRLIRVLLVRYYHLLGFGLLALAGVVALGRARRWTILMGLAALGPGIALFLVFLSARGTFVATRYLVPVDMAVLFTAGIGAGGLVAWGSQRLRSPAAQRPTLVVGAGAALAGLVALLAGWPPGLTDGATRATADAQLRQAVDEQAALTTLAAAVDTIPRSRAVAPGPGDHHYVLLVPVPLRTRLAVDLDLPLTRLGSTSPATLTPLPGPLAEADLVFHDRAGDIPGAGYAILEQTGPNRVADLTLEPILVDPARGIWIYRVGRG